MMMSEAAEDRRTDRTRAKGAEYDQTRHSAWNLVPLRLRGPMRIDPCATGPDKKS
jgi:hypothetical protein